MLGQHSPNTLTVATFDRVVPASLLTLHLYIYSPTVSEVSVVCNALLPTVVQLLPEFFLSQEYTNVPTPLAVQLRVILLPDGTSPSDG